MIKIGLWLLLGLSCVSAVAQTLTYSFSVTPADVKSGNSLHWVFTETAGGANFDEHSTFGFSSDCPQIMVFGQTNDITNILSLSWTDDDSPYLAFDERTLCTFNIKKDGIIVATATATFEETPQDNLGPQDCCGGEPIDFASGNVYIQQTDISVPGLNGGLKLVRTWNSLFSLFNGNVAANGLFGNNWRSNYEESIVTGDGGIAHYSRGDGSVWTFRNTSGSPTHYSLTAPGNTSATLDRGAQFWTLVFKNGETRLFDAIGGYLVAIKDRNNNTTSISHDSLARILTVTDPAFRHLFFHYGNGFSQQVSSVTSDVGITVSYEYGNEIFFIVTDSEMLTRVTYPDQSTVSFTYVFSQDFRSTLISSVLDSDGKVLETHTYGARNRGLTSSKANGVEKLTVTYPQ